MIVKIHCSLEHNIYLNICLGEKSANAAGYNKERCGAVVFVLIVGGLQRVTHSILTAMSAVGGFVRRVGKIWFDGDKTEGMEMRVFVCVLLGRVRVI